MGSGSKNDSRIKKKKQKMVFAKDKNQLILMIVVLVIFFANSIYMIVKYVQEQNPAPQTANQNVSPPPEDPNMPEQQPTEELAQNQNAPVDDIQNQNIAQDANDIYSQTVNLQKNESAPNLNTIQNSENDVDIISKKSLSQKNGRMVLISVANSERINPFLPASESLAKVPAKIITKNITKHYNNTHKKVKVAISYPYLLPPPKTLPQDTDAGKIMSTTISGILYDKYSPSAIINVDGSDYLVKQGDVVNQYKILMIDKTKVIVQLGRNIYQAGVGELLSQSNLNYNSIANLDKKFGGNDISINVRRKGY